jgi:hypothetical protein
MEIFGLFGLILIAALVLWLRDKAGNKECHACRKSVDYRATKCPYCQSELAYPARG